MDQLFMRRKRELLFVCVGGFCFVVQFLILAGLAGLGAYRPLANAVGFAISAQVNFFLSSKLTWRDRPAGAWRAVRTRLFSYNGTALASLAVNSAVFAVCYRAVGTLLAAMLGVFASMCFVYLTSNMLVFRQQPEAVRSGRACL